MRTKTVHAAVIAAALTEMTPTTPRIARTPRTTTRTELLPAIQSKTGVVLDHLLMLSDKTTKQSRGPKLRDLLALRVKPFLRTSGSGDFTMPSTVSHIRSIPVMKRVFSAEDDPV